MAIEIERAYGVRIEIADSGLTDCTVTTWFADRSLQQVPSVACAVAVVECRLHDGLVTIEAR